MCFEVLRRRRRRRKGGSFMKYSTLGRRTIVLGIDDGDRGRIDDWMKDWNAWDNIDII